MGELGVGVCWRYVCSRRGVGRWSPESIIFVQLASESYGPGGGTLREVSQLVVIDPLEVLLIQEDLDALLDVGDFGKKRPLI